MRVAPIHPSARLRRRVVLAATAAVTATLALTASAVAPAQAATSLTQCGIRTTNTVLAGLGDKASYYVANGGTFEFGSLPWLTSRASVVSGNEPWKVLPGFNSSSLQINPGGTASSGYDCNANGEDSLRFFYRGPGVPGSTLRVTVGALVGLSVVTRSYDVPGSTSGWALSPSLAVPNERGLLGAQIITVSFAAVGTPATWQIDDVVVDPWRTL